ncbi:hypothetical protein FQR65_LT17727 [Abscondita terminalis]|nr:hypothetical protein FQR65_LT17727 [Abscondita terminalis]
MLTRPTTPVLSKDFHKQAISTSFLDHIFWPEESPQKNSSCRKKERLPHATTSLRWLQYHEDKEKLKMQKEEIKREKAVLRKQKKEEKIEKAKTKLLIGCKKQKEKRRQDSESEEQEEWSESGSSIDDISDEHFTSDSDNEPLPKITKKEESCSSQKVNEALDKITKGEFYLVSFPGKKKSHNYVCCIQNIFSSKEVEVQALSAIDEDKLTYKIIEGDISTVDIEQLLYKLHEPNIIGFSSLIFGADNSHKITPRSKICVTYFLNKIHFFLQLSLTTSSEILEIIALSDAFLALVLPCGEKLSADMYVMSYFQISNSQKLHCC